MVLHVHCTQCMKHVHRLGEFQHFCDYKEQFLIKFTQNEAHMAFIIIHNFEVCGITLFASSSTF